MSSISRQKWSTWNCLARPVVLDSDANRRIRRDPLLKYAHQRVLEGLGLRIFRRYEEASSAGGDGSRLALFERGELAAARRASDQWSYGSPGVGTVGHLGMELLKSKTGINPVHVPYPGYPQVANAMLGGQLQLSLLPPALAMAQIRAGKLRAIGITSSGRSTLVPELPSLAKAGVAGFNLEIWNAIAAPNSLPKPVAARLSALFSEIARTPEMRQKLFQQGWQVAGTSAEGLANRIRADSAALGAIIAARGPE